MDLDQHLKLERCPHCAVDKPNLQMRFELFKTSDDRGYTTKMWGIYICSRCGNVVLAGASTARHPYQVKEIYPAVHQLDDVLPERVKSYLQQAIDSTAAPAGSVMLCASAVDAMLKEKGYKQGSLYKRIEEAVKAGLLTPEMSLWAHQVRLGANDQRHSDEEATLPSVEDAKQAIEFSRTLAEFLFVLPSKVTRGIETTKPSAS